MVSRGLLSQGMPDRHPVMPLKALLPFTVPGLELPIERSRRRRCLDRRWPIRSGLQKDHAMARPRALENIGFLLAVNHGVAEDLTEGVER